MAADVERPVICSKCGATSGNDWKQCGGSCPLPDSPHYKAPAVVELTPLPEFPAAVERFILSTLGPMKAEGARTALRTMLRAYALANVAHATAAKDAEIEALRAEVDEWKAIATWEKEQHDRLFKEARALNERAQQLADALRDATTMLLADYPVTAKRLRAVITAAQENDDAT